MPQADTLPAPAIATVLRELATELREAVMAGDPFSICLECLASRLESLADGHLTDPIDDDDD